MPRVRETNITHLQAYTIRETLIKNGYTQFYNKYCPFSVFWTKEVGNKIYYVRVDEDSYYKITIYKYERWIRDPSKFNLNNLSEQDSDLAQATKPEHVPDLLDFIEQASK